MRLEVLTTEGFMSSALNMEAAVSSETLPQMRDATSQSAVFFAIFETCLHCKRCSKTAEIGNGLRFSVAC
jgi:hypothetical protein